MTFLGIHIRANEKYESNLVVLDCTSTIIQTSTFKSNDQLYDLISTINPNTVALGSPTSLPLELCCLEIDCGCTYDIDGNKGRVSEIQMASMSISCFYTTRGSISRTLIYRSMDIFKTLTELNYKVIETYPYATKSILFKENASIADSQNTLQTTYDNLSSRVFNMGQSNQWDKKSLDAVLSSYTALLHHQDKTNMLGIEKEGLLVVPDLTS